MDEVPSWVDVDSSCPVLRSESLVVLHQHLELSSHLALTGRDIRCLFASFHVLFFAPLFFFGGGVVVFFFFFFFFASYQNRPRGQKASLQFSIHYLLLPQPWWWI